MPRCGAEALLHLLAESGVKFLFGNPGSTELPLMDALVRQDRIRYVLGLHEVPVMAMADGYAQASGQLGVVNLHIACGLGNAMGMLYNAHRSGTPLLVTAGQQDRRLAFDEPVLWADLVRVAQPWTKWAAEVARVEDLPNAVRRAVQTALMPPRGPVFLAVPVDVQMEPADMDLTPPRPLDHRLRPPLAAVQQAAEVLAAARSPAILVGSRVAESDAMAELAALAETLGAPAMHEPATNHGRLGFPTDHPLFLPGLPLWSPDIRARLQAFDVLLVVGADLLRLYIHHQPARPIPESTRLVQLDCHPAEIGKNFPVEVGLVGDLKTGLTELRQQLEARLSDAQRQAAGRRVRQFEQTQRQTRSDLRREIAAEQSLRPMTAATLMATLAGILPSDVAVVEEAATTTQTLFERLGALRDPRGYFGQRGWALGWGLGCALGVKLAWPQRPVLCVLGEGAAMYGIQGLWTAAHEKIPVTFVVANNASYRILKVCARQYGLPSAQSGVFKGMDLIDPQIDFVGLARSLGVAAHRVAEPEELAQRVRDGLAGSEPVLLDVPIQAGGPPA